MTRANKCLVLSLTAATTFFSSTLLTLLSTGPHSTPANFAQVDPLPLRFSHHSPRTIANFDAYCCRLSRRVLPTCSMAYPSQYRLTEHRLSSDSTAFVCKHRAVRLGARQTQNKATTLRQNKGFRGWCTAVAMFWWWRGCRGRWIESRKKTSSSEGSLNKGPCWKARHQCNDNALAARHK